MSILDTPVYASVIVFALGAFALYVLKLDVMFKETGEFRQFGLGEGETLFHFNVVVCLIALFTYIIQTLAFYAPLTGATRDLIGSSQIPLRSALKH